MSNSNPYQNSLSDDDGQSPHRTAYYAQKTSGLAILSVMSGLASFPMMCLCFMSIPFSVFAIVAGHMSRGIVRDTNGQYSGMEMATFGLILGYCSLFLMTGLLLVSFVTGERTSSSVAIVTHSSTEGTVLLKQAKAQLLGGIEAATFGVSTTDGNADALSRHFVDTLHVLDATYFTETNTAQHLLKRNYRAFVQLNKNSAVFLLLVPDYQRFTDSALEILYERCWLIAQRTLDGVLPENADLAVAIYSVEGVRKVMVGKSQRSESSNSGLMDPDAPENILADFFLLEKEVSEGKERRKSSVDSYIDVRNPANVELPAEAD